MGLKEPPLTAKMKAPTLLAVARAMSRKRGERERRIG